MFFVTRLPAWVPPGADIPVPGSARAPGSGGAVEEVVIKEKRSPDRGYLRTHVAVSALSGGSGRKI
ncbi:hypothetical protein ACFVYA_29230 [Amycolatopsis sp. NPDC058278]|uniref:hypothetical protein n=1 Tax=unclassified Amycolatopsis TaxID=2618356 RepID=UPI00255C2174|nr:hypothetical protein [Amycolatopsis sp. DG1A-15b]WIX85628.1 hypothetical protein QRY02_30945 [Amycolatopsis sp. DG1A-15b]